MVYQLTGFFFFLSKAFPKKIRFTSKAPAKHNLKERLYLFGYPCKISFCWAGKKGKRFFG
jgi:hypothetical protein